MGAETHVEKQGGTGEFLSVYVLSTRWFSSPARAVFLPRERGRWRTTKSRDGGGASMPIPSYPSSHIPYCHGRARPGHPSDNKATHTHPRTLPHTRSPQTRKPHAKPIAVRAFNLFTMSKEQPTSLRPRTSAVKSNSWGTMSIFGTEQATPDEFEVRRRSVAWPNALSAQGY